jgi:hypothetical protein
VFGKKLENPEIDVGCQTMPAENNDVDHFNKNNNKSEDLSNFLSNTLLESYMLI